MRKFLFVLQQVSVKLLLVALLLGLSVAVVSARTNKKPLKAKGGSRILHTRIIH
jgi:hypothetical protein